MLTHVEKYHKAEKNFVTVKQQFAVACAIFEQKQAGPKGRRVCVLSYSDRLYKVSCIYPCEALSPLAARPAGTDTLLSQAAMCMRDWVSLDAASLHFVSKQNTVDMALLLTRAGPKYVLKQHTAQALRINKMLYISNDFADLVLAKAIKHRGKIHSMFNDITTEWVCQGSPCAWLGCRRGDTRQAVFEQVMALKPVQALRTALIATATVHAEWVVCSHDATYQVLFSAIGQMPMQQKEGEFHALHTFLGRSGAVPGFSLQRTEGPDSFRSAVAQVLPHDARMTVKYMFSDNPASVEGSTDVLPNLEAVAEDALHLVLRVEACTGEKRTALSSNLLRIMLRFRLPCAGSFFHGGTDGDDEHDAGQWSDGVAKDGVPADWDWDARVTKPYSGHQEFINDIEVLCAQHLDQMKRKDKKGRTIQQVLKAGTSYTHFRYLWNGSHIIAALHQAMPPKEVELLSFGTCSNEALQFQLKVCQEQIIQQHIQTFPPQLEAFSLAKLLAHHSAAYSPTLAQRKESEILSLMQGWLTKGFLPPLEEGRIQPTLSREDLRRPVHQLDPQKVAIRKDKAREKAKQWSKEVQNRKLKHPQSRLQKPVCKRTVFTQKKLLDCKHPHVGFVAQAEQQLVHGTHAADQSSVALQHPTMVKLRALSNQLFLL